MEELAVFASIGTRATALYQAGAAKCVQAGYSTGPIAAYTQHIVAHAGTVERATMDIRLLLRLCGATKRHHGARFVAREILDVVSSTMYRIGCDVARSTETMSAMQDKLVRLRSLAGLDDQLFPHYQELVQLVFIMGDSYYRLHIEMTAAATQMCQSVTASTYAPHVNNTTNTNINTNNASRQASPVTQTAVQVPHAPHPQ
jgi:hypothetical protein